MLLFQTFLNAITIIMKKQETKLEYTLIPFWLQFDNFDSYMKNINCLLFNKVVKKLQALLIILINV